MNSVDNFDLIQEYVNQDLNSKSSDKFYFVQVLMRKGTNISDSNSNRARTLKTFYVPSTVPLNEYKEEVVYYCERTGTRAYINLNARSFKKTALQSIKLLSDSITNGHEISAHTIYNKALMDVPIVGRKTWFLDFDRKDYEHEWEYNAKLLRCELRLTDYNIDYTVVPSKSGLHILMKPFRRDILLKELQDYEIKAELKIDSSTNLYVSSD